MQDKLREEIKQAGNGQDIPYDELVDLPYLDAVCRETLRVWVPDRPFSDILLTITTVILPSMRSTESMYFCFGLNTFFVRLIPFHSCKKDMVLPLSEPIRGVDGRWIKEIPVPKNTGVIVSIRGCNRNKAIWGEDAHEWKPERWLSPLPEPVTDARIPGVYSNMWV